MSTMTHESQSVFVVNEGDAPWFDSYDGVVYMVEPGGKTVAPVAAAKLWFGDWDSNEDPRRGRTRKAEKNRLYQRYGVVLDANTTDEEFWAQNAPKVKVKTIQGDAIPTVIDDPDGVSKRVHIETVSDRDELMALIRTTQEDLATMKKMYQDESRKDAAIVGSDVEEDVVASPPSKRARNQRPDAVVVE